MLVDVLPLDWRRPSEAAMHRKDFSVWYAPEYCRPLTQSHRLLLCFLLMCRPGVLCQLLSVE